MTARLDPIGGAPPTDPLYRMDGVIHAYGSKTALTLPDLSIESGGIIGLAGPNGSGKSTLLRLLGFVDAPTHGTIRFAGRLARPFDAHVRFQVALLPQDAYLLRRSVADNIRYGLGLRGLHGEADARIAEALAAVGLDPERFARRSRSALSGGEARRVAFAARLALRPAALLLDEPTAGVDVDSAERIKAAALQARDRWQTTVVIAGHDWQWLYDVCDRVYHLQHGRLYDCGPMATVTGPWDMSPARGACRRLDDGQIFVAPGAPSIDAVALVDACAVMILGENDIAESSSSMRARVTRLIYAHRPGRVIVGLDVGGVSLMAWADAATAIRIGQEVRCAVSADGIHWHLPE